MQNVTKDNLTDLVDDAIRPQEAKPKPNEDNKPSSQPKQPKDLDDYQVTTPDGEVIGLTLQKADKSSMIKKVLSGTSKNGDQYILVVDKNSSKNT